MTASSVARHSLPRHRKAARMIGFALVAGDPALWPATSLVLQCRLTTLELSGLAFAAMRTLEPDDRQAVFDAAQWGVAS